MNIFAYGSLIIPEVWESVTGELHRSEPGRISGFIRRTIHGATYPGIIASETGAGDVDVDGAIYYDVGAEALAALDEFESDFYVRSAVDAVATDGGGGLVACQAYLVPEANAHLLSESEWDLERFAAEHLEEFLARNFG